MNTHVTFDNLPEAVMSLHEKLDTLDSKIETLSRNQRFANEHDQLIGVDEAAKCLKITKAGIYSKVSRNAIPYYKIGGKLYFSRAELFAKILAARNPPIDKPKKDESPVTLQHLFLDKFSPTLHR
jgi:excisionase family DNA binding protein